MSKRPGTGKRQSSETRATLGRGRSIINPDDLPHTEHAHELVGAHFGVPISLILVHSGPGTGPAMHRHDYAEVFVLEQGTATFRVEYAEFVAQPGQIVIAPPGAYHGFTNTGSGQLRLTAIHTAPNFKTEWLAEPDTEWVSPKT